MYIQYKKTFWFQAKSAIYVDENDITSGILFIIAMLMILKCPEESINF